MGHCAETAAFMGTDLNKRTGDIFFLAVACLINESGDALITYHRIRRYLLSHRFQNVLVAVSALQDIGELRGIPQGYISRRKDVVFWMCVLRWFML